MNIDFPKSGYGWAIKSDQSENQARVIRIQANLIDLVKRGELSDIGKDLPLKHSFINGGYCREMNIPSGTLLVGKIHRHSCFNFVMKGRITVLSAEGVKEITAPASFVSGPGTKRVGYAHEDTIWATVHITDETDLDALEKIVTIESPDDVITQDIPRLLEGISS